MGDFNRSVFSLSLCHNGNFIMYDTEIGICHKPKQIAKKTQQKNAKCESSLRW